MSSINRQQSKIKAGARDATAQRDRLDRQLSQQGIGEELGELKIARVVAVSTDYDFPIYTVELLGLDRGETGAYWAGVRGLNDTIILMEGDIVMFHRPTRTIVTTGGGGQFALEDLPDHVHPCTFIRSGD